MDLCGLACLHDFLGDFVIYRNLEPYDPRLPRLATVQAEIGLPANGLPRKSDGQYAQIVAHILRAAQAITHPGVPLTRLLYLGDTHVLDSTAFRNLKAQTGWQGWAFIASEDLSAPPALALDGDVFLANRWGGVAEVLAFLADQGFPLDAGTAVVVDLDKTAIGARGRNDRMIDEARLTAVYDTVAGILGQDGAAAEFDAAYAELNQFRYHPFTADNQDYLTYICLMLSARLYDLSSLLDDLASGRMKTFPQFLEHIDGRVAVVGNGVAEIHDQFLASVRRGDPTPFKAFRRNEYRTTIARMGCLDNGTTVEQALACEIVITQEVRDLALRLRGQGALLFGLTDKPDEAALPPPELAAQGYLPLHRARTHAVGRRLWP